MKKILALALAIVFVIGFTASAWAAGSVTVTRSTSNGGDIEIIIFSWTADASNGSVPATSGATAYPTTKAGYIIKVATDPGSPAPTASYDITLTDNVTGADLMGGELVDRATATSEEAVPKMGNAYGANFASNAFTLNITNNSVNSAKGTVYVYIAK